MKHWVRELLVQRLVQLIEYEQNDEFRELYRLCLNRITA